MLHLILFIVPGSLCENRLKQTRHARGGCCLSLRDVLCHVVSHLAWVDDKLDVDIGLLGLEDDPAVAVEPPVVALWNELNSMTKLSICLVLPHSY